MEDTHCIYIRRVSYRVHIIVKVGLVAYLNNLPLRPLISKGVFIMLYLLHTKSGQVFSKLLYQLEIITISNRFFMLKKCLTKSFPEGTL